MRGSKPILATVLVLILIGSTISLWRSCSRRSPPFRAGDWFYDLNTQQLFAGPRGAVPPIDAPSGPLPDGTPAGVRAKVFGCGGCAAEQRTIAWLETYTVPDRDLLRSPPPDPNKPETLKPVMPTAPVTLLIKRVADPAWVGQTSPAGAELMTASLPQCPGELVPQECWP
jgi:hypothetical protein